MQSDSSANVHFQSEGVLVKWAWQIFHRGLLVPNFFNFSQTSTMRSPLSTEPSPSFHLVLKKKVLSWVLKKGVFALICHMHSSWNTYSPIVCSGSQPVSVLAICNCQYACNTQLPVCLRYATASMLAIRNCQYACDMQLLASILAAIILLTASLQCAAPRAQSDTAG